MRLVGVGMGPGDPELVTVKAVRLLRSADRVYVPAGAADEDRLLEGAVRAHLAGATRSRPDGTTIEVERVRRLTLTDADAAETVARFVVSGGTAAVATIGDPNVYSGFAALAQAVRAMLPAVTVQTIPGVTAAQEIASRSGIPLVEGDEPLTLLPLAGGVGGLDDALSRVGSVVVYQSGRHLIGVKEAVRRAGRLHGALYGARLGLPGEELRPLAGTDGNAAPYLSSVLVPARRGGVR